MKFTPTVQIVLAAGAILLIALVVFFLAVFPMFGELDQARSDKQAAEARIDAAQVRLGRLRDAKTQAAEVQADLIELANRVPESPQLPTLLIDLQDAANRTDMDFLSVSPAQSEMAPGVNELPLNVTVTGAWRDLISYTRFLDDMVREFRIVSMSIQPRDEEEPGVGDEVEETDNEEDVSVVTAVLEIRTYVIEPTPAAENGGDGEAPAAPES